MIRQIWLLYRDITRDIKPYLLYHEAMHDRLPRIDFLERNQEV